MKTAYLVIGVPGSGKSWVCEQLTEVFEYVSHDASISKDYVKEIMRASLSADKPLLIEAPFSISEIKDPLEARGFRVTPIFIFETLATVGARYRKREGKTIPPAHIARMRTYQERAQKWKSFSGTSEQVLQHLKNIAENF